MRLFLIEADVTIDARLTGREHLRFFTVLVVREHENLPTPADVDADVSEFLRSSTIPQPWRFETIEVHELDPSETGGVAKEFEATRHSHVEAALRCLPRKEPQ